jgi:uncharacterized protein (TIGR02217 family)
MAFDEVRFPTLISWGFGGGPEYNTDVIILSSGYEKRNSNWSIARGKYEVAHNMKSQTQLAELITFFRARQGKARGFRFRDWNDYKLETQTIGTGNGVQTVFQIIKTYTNSVTETRNITKIVSQADSNTIATAHGSTAITFEVRVNSVLKVETSDYTIDRNTGIITFLSPVTNTHVITVSCEFDVPVRFDTDRMMATIDQHNSHSWSGIPLVEVRI